MTRRTRWIVFLAKAAFSAALVYFVCTKLELDEVVGRLREANLLWLAAALTSSLFGVALQAARWRALTFNLLSLRAAYTYTFIGLFYGAFLPGGVSGDVAKGAALALKHSAGRSGLVALSVVADRMAGLYVLCAIFFGGALVVITSDSPVGASLEAVAVAGLWVTGFVLVSGPFLLTAPVARLIRSLAQHLPVKVAQKVALAVVDSLHRYRHASGLWLRVGGLSFLGHVVNVLTNACLLYALGATMSLQHWIVYYSLISLLIMVPISISGLGVRDWFALHFFPSVGLLGTLGVAYSWLSLGLNLVIALIGGAVQLTELFWKSHPAPEAGLPEESR